MSLRIEVGDTVQLRQLRFNAFGIVYSGSLIKDANGNPIELSRHNDTQHNSVVWGIDRLRETLALRVDSFAPRSMQVNVRFTVQTERLRAVYKAAIVSQQALRASDTSWMRSMLLPRVDDGCYQTTLNKGVTTLDLYDELLNYEQQKAVDAVLNESYGSVPYVISGPPGTGKTKTIVELALQLAFRDDRTHLIVCAPSDPAADTLIQRISKYFGPDQLLRLNAPSRSFPETPNSVLPYCFVDNGMFSVPPFEQVMRSKVVVSTCRDADILVRARLSNRDLHNLEGRMYSTIHPASLKTKLQLHWTGLLIDEAAQAPEPEVLIPISVVAPPHTDNSADLKVPILVMAGDQDQLGPRTASKSEAIQTSLLQRLLNRPFYREHPLARPKQRGGVIRPLNQDMLPILRPAFTDLIRNYRSHPAILATPSLLFYHDTLEPEAAKTDSLIPWSGWKGRGWPVLFACNNAPDEIEQDGGGWYNLKESKMACDYAASFLRAGLLQQYEICIMSPFAAQVRILRKMAREPPYSMAAVNIGPLEAFQGLESRLVVICTTRTRDRFIDQDIAKGLGVIHEPRRFNVALTRAKEGLIVIGNPMVLKMDGNWKVFMDFCRRNGLWEDRTECSWKPQPNQSQAISRLEKRLLYENEIIMSGQMELGDTTTSMRQLGVADNDDSLLWDSGVAAEKALRNGE